MRFRALLPDEIDVRVGQIGDKKATMLLYKNARVDMNILDETVGPERWMRDHKEIKGNLYCGVAIADKGLEHWIWKWDCGTESNTEKEKGEASDSFKRACVNWGIGRELYEGPRIVLPVATDRDERTGKYKLHNQFELYGIYVKEIEYKEDNAKRIITKLVLNQKQFNKDLGEVYRWQI